MEFNIIEREPEAFQQAVSPEQISTLVRRAFGPEVVVKAVHEFGVGTFNNTYLIDMEGQNKVVLRVAPALDKAISEDERHLMRREYLIQPFLTGLGQIVPKILMADFTRQIINRDYMFQSYLPGRVWTELEPELSDEDRIRLWQQLGKVTKQIHQVKGEAFGVPLLDYPCQQWTEAVLNWIGRGLRDLKAVQVDLSNARKLLELVKQNLPLLEVIQKPCLLHGDLWPFNVLVERREDGSSISGILDADRAWWGDPLADWSMFLLRQAIKPKSLQQREYFYQGYGEPEITENLKFRELVYDAAHVVINLGWGVRNNDAETIERGTRDLARLVAELEGSVS
jgi:aminoglycoside phosphotransferase (APT) family kinase protein